MKNKNNVTVTELVNTIMEVQRKKNNNEFAYAYALGTLQAIVDWELKGYSDGLQNAINRSYEVIKVELDALPA
jgi:hypothetical protein